MTAGRRLDFALAPPTCEHVGVVFADLSGYVQFTARHGDVAAAQLLELNRLTVAPIIAAHDGRTVKNIGDGLLLSFPDPTQAILAALAIVRAASDLLAVRASVHWGEALAVGTDLIGSVVNTAARVVDVARPGQVLVTDAAREAADRSQPIYFARRRRLELKGIATSIAVSAASSSRRSTGHVSAQGD